MVMTDCKTLMKQIQKGSYDDVFSGLYGFDGVESARSRYIRLIRSFTEYYGEKPVALFSAPGRTEIGGNHTDHQNGRVLAAAINLDIIGVASYSDDNIVRIKSEGHSEDSVGLDGLDPVSVETGHSASLVRGICSRFAGLGYKVGGFCAYTVSDVLKGSGLSSSAAFEVITGTIINNLFNEAKVTPIEIAKIGQYAETVFYGKPSGLMDQTASASGGFVTIDFKDPDNPAVEKVDFDFEKSGHSLCIVNCGGNHANLNDEYASITREMRSVANIFGSEKLREADNGDFLAKIAGLRGKCNDRAILRAGHFFADNERVTAQVKALRAGDFDKFKEIIIESGNSSYKYLQNIFLRRMLKTKAFRWP